MFKNFKLSSISWFFSGLLAVIAIVITVSALRVENNILEIDETWQLYQTDLSEKARFEGALQAAIGFDGMIHDFKNYILRNEELYIEHVEDHIGAASAILNQYAALRITAAESIAIEDIKGMLRAYDDALHKVVEMTAQGHHINELVQAVTIDDGPAIRGLQVLRNEVISKNNKKPLTKSRIVADLRAALGYSGMIHKFKDYLLHQASNNRDVLPANLEITEIRQKTQQVINSIKQYHQYNLTEAEQLALKDIQLVLTAYASNLNVIQQMSAQKKSVKEIDAVVRVDDTIAVRGLQVLDREINDQLAESSENITALLKQAGQVIELGKWSSIFAIFFVIFIAIVLVRFYIVRPVLRLTNNMIRLADNQLDTKIEYCEQKNEIGEMAKAVLVFKTNMIKRQEAEKALAEVNADLQKQLEENKLLRAASEEQATKAVLMSEHMISVSQKSEKAMAEAEKEKLFVSSILNAVRDAIITINSKGIIEALNPGAEKIFGYKSFELIGKNISLLMPEPNRSAHDGYLEHFSEGKSTRDQSQPMEQLALRKNGETFPADVTLNTIKISGETKITGVVRDVTDRKQWEEQIRALAMTDPLTGAANRHHYDLHLLEVLKNAQRFKMQFAIMALDLDRFKPVNDNYGHAVGDILLREVADILVEETREVDLVARLGGDEFSIVFNGIHEPEEVALIAERIINRLSASFDIEHNKIQIGISMGISCYPGDSEDIETLKRLADEALYVAKNEGRNTYRFCTKTSG